jgi:hypothetical protein
MTMERIGYDSLYKRALGTARHLAQFLQAFDPQTASLLRLDTIEPRGTELFDVLPAWYRRVADIVAQVEADGAGRELLLIHVEVQRTKQQHFGQRMLDYYTLLRRSTSLPVLPYAVLLYPGRPALGYKTYEERFRGRTVASLTYFQVSLPSLDARQYAASDNALARALASTMRLPNLEEERLGIYRTAIAAILGALGRAEMDDDAAAALWTLVHTYLPYRIERPDEVDVEWSEEDAGMVQRLDQKWLAEIEARGEMLGALRAKRAWLKEDIARRFGALPPEVAARIDGVESEDQLDAIKSRLDTATTPDELFP